jgi:tight adherence protein B
MMRRVAAATIVALALIPSAAAASALSIVGTDSAGYPHLVVNVVTPSPVASPPGLEEDGVPVAALQAVNLGAAKSIVVAIDNSQSMKGRSIVDAGAAARTFVDAKAAADRVALFVFGRHVLQLTGFSASSAEADGVLRGLAVDGSSGTALYDAIVAAARALRASTQPGRVIIVLTDGRDVSSTASLDAAVAAARKANASIYPIGIESTDFDPGALRTLAKETGGTYHGAGSSVQLQAVYRSIASELHRTWRLGYDTSARPGDRIGLRATVPGVGAVEQSVAVPVAFGQTTDVPPSRVLPSVVYTPAGTIIIALLVGGLFLGVIILLSRIQRKSWVAQRLAPHVTQKTQRQGGQGDRLSFLKALFTATEGAFGRHRKWRSIERLLVRGDVPLRPAEFVWLMIGCGVGVGLLLSFAGTPAMVIFGGILIGGALPYGFVTFRVRRRIKAFEDQLPDLLTTIAASLKAGHSFKHGLQSVLDEAQPPASDELRRVLTEAGLGRPLDDALGDMAERLGSENFGFAITAVTIQRQVGGSLATLFDMVSETVRNRQQFARKISSLTAMGRMSAYTLVGVPFFIAAVVSLMNPSYMHPLYHTHSGHLLIAIGMAMMGVGALVLKKIVSFKG